MKAIILLFAFVFLSGAPVLKLSNVFSDDMVLQAGVEVPLWGKAAPDSEVTVEISGDQLSTKATGEGKWKVLLPPHDYGGDYKIIITSGSEMLELENVVFGDVWVCAGQSNMRFELYRSLNGEEAILNSTRTDIRHLKIQERYSEKELEDVEAGGWQMAAPKSSGDFTAVGYYFARKIAKNTGHAIGLINVTRGGSRIETWMPENSFRPGYLQYLFDSVAGLEKKSKEALIDRLGYTPSTFLSPEFQNFWKSEVLDQGWIDQSLPERWEIQGFPNLDGQVYYAKDFMFNHFNGLDKEAKVHLATIDDADSVWLNGQFIGATEGWNVHRKYNFSAHVLNKGMNRILVKVNDLQGSGGIRGDASQMFLEVGEKRIDLAGNWKFKVAELNYSSPVRPRYLPTLFFNAMVHPITQLPVKGVLWYQGENNARTIEDARDYEEMFFQFISSWRGLWDNNKLPFYYVQLPNHDADNIEQEAWAIMRESQRKALSIENTGMVVTIDLGDSDDIHPVRKKEVGDRLADIALNRLYGIDTDDASPSITGLELNKQKIVLSLSEPIQASQGKIKGFQLFDPNGKSLELVGEYKKGLQIEIKVPKGFKPDWLKYAWGNDPAFTVIRDRQSLPMAPFSISINNTK